MHNYLSFGLILIIINYVAAIKSPNAYRLNELVNTGRYSNNILEDASLSAPDLIKKYGYPSDIHHTTTDDGYILELHRIPHGRHQNNDPNVKRTSVLLLHGLLSSSADWIIMGPTFALGYILAESGYDVWLGNARGNYYSRSHVNIEPDNDSSFWNFSWEEIGFYDIPAMIDYILATTFSNKLHYIGHSQGTTAFFVMGSMRPEYNDKIISMQALAPVAYMEHITSLFMTSLAPLANSLQTILSLLGYHELPPKPEVLDIVRYETCMEESKYHELCVNLLMYVLGRNEDQFNSTMVPVMLGHSPAGSSIKQLAHYGQSIHQNTFRRYNYGWLRNLIVYGSRTPPDYQLHHITAPIFLHYSVNDHFADIEDVYRLIDEIPTIIDKNRVIDQLFTHMDFIWGIDAKSLVWDKAIFQMRSMDNINC